MLRRNCGVKLILSYRIIIWQDFKKWLARNSLRIRWVILKIIAWIDSEIGCLWRLMDRNYHLNTTLCKASSPALRTRASNISCMVTRVPGRLTVHEGPIAPPSRQLAWRILLMAVRGLESQSDNEWDTGQTASLPFSGSRIMLLTNDEAALFGLPGRTQIVGNRNIRPSM